MSNALIKSGLALLGLGYVVKALEPEKPTALGRGPGGASKSQAAQLQQAQARAQAKDGVRKVVMHGVENIDQRVGHIVKQIVADSMDPQVISEARAIVSQKCRSMDGGKRWCVDAKDRKGEADALYYAVSNPNSPFAIRYTSDHARVDLFGSSALLRRLPSGDCDDSAIRLGAWLRALGFEVVCRVIQAKGEHSWSHIYLAAQLPDGRWYPLDPTEPQHGPGWEVPKHLVVKTRDWPVP